MRCALQEKKLIEQVPVGRSLDLRVFIFKKVPLSDLLPLLLELAPHSRRSSYSLLGIIILICPTQIKFRIC